ncbi:Glutathione S-transferase [Sphingomonas sp. OV641]|uniref:glutathione S-transferase family protein n=1 Tax=Sphingomonas sp. OV641 TaxID=1881068 RepID=UPI0008D6D023|nr:glutathione S-transferase family protein [Sphingomonas sp. OV641]SEI92621.1 Glutathione S-transferase [Sphingomonas sp. OV641]
MIQLYHCADARSFRALWALEELKLPYQLHLLPFPPRVREPSYLDANPLGTIPLLIDGDARLTESAAIVQYLAVKYGPTPLAVGPEEADYGAWLNWLHFGEATLTFPQTLVLRYRMLEPPERRLPQAADDYAQWFHSRLRHVERALGDRKWLVADRFTMADISVGYALLLAKSLKIDDGFPPQVAAYWQRLKGREGFGRAKDAQKSG